MQIIEWLNLQFQPLLAKAEELYGPCEDKIWNFVGIGFAEDGPYIYFPNPEKDEIAIVLHTSALNDTHRALHQFSHEIIHLLHINRKPPTTLLEEGVAVHFSLYGPAYQSEDYRDIARNYYIEEKIAENYRDALLSFERLREIDQDAVKKIRTKEPNLSVVKPELIKEIFPEIDENLAELLCEHRKMR